VSEVAEALQSAKEASHIDNETWAQLVRELRSKWPRVFSNSSIAAKAVKAAKERLSMAVDKGDLYELTESLQNAEEALELEDKEGLMATVDRGDVSEVVQALQSATEASHIDVEEGLMATVDRGDLSEVAESLQSAKEVAHIDNEEALASAVDAGDVSEVAYRLHNAEEEPQRGGQNSAIAYAMKRKMDGHDFTEHSELQKQMGEYVNDRSDSEAQIENSSFKR